MVLTSLAFLTSIVAAWWRESHQPWQSWQVRAYQLQTAQLATQIANELDSGTRASLEAKRAELLKVQHVEVGLVPAQFECPCHGSQFDAEGRVLIGPATRSLERVRLTLANDGRVVVDRAALVNVDFRLAI